MRKTITSITIAVAIAGTAAAGAEAPPPLLSFYPQAGTLGQDLFVANHVDLDDGPGILDFACSGDTYDGHTGQDTGIRSFREVALGVPVFAALDGRVFNIQLAVGGDLNWGGRSRASTTTSSSTTATACTRSTATWRGRA